MAMLLGHFTTNQKQRLSGMGRMSLESLLSPGLPGSTLAALREALAQADSTRLPVVAEDHPLLLFALMHRAASLAASPQLLPRSAQEACDLMGHPHALYHLRLVATLLTPADPAEAAWERVASLRQAGDLLLRMVQDGALLDFPQPGPVERTLLRLMEVPALQPLALAPAAWGAWLLAAGGGARWWHSDVAEALLAMADPTKVPGAAGRRAVMMLTVAESGLAGPGADADLLRQWERAWASSGTRRHG